MHRHGYQGRKFGRERDQRSALLKGLADSLIIHESIVTTLPKAKEVVPYVEHLITKAKKSDLHNRRQIIASLNTVSSAHKLVDEIAPKLKGRTSGHLRIAKEGNRRGDNAAMARVSFVDDLKAPAAKPVAAVSSQQSAASKAVAAKKPAAKPTVKKTAAKPVEKAAVKKKVEAKK